MKSSFLMRALPASVIFATATLLTPLTVSATTASQHDTQDLAPVALDRSKVPSVLNMALPAQDKVYGKFDAGSGVTGWVVGQGGEPTGEPLVAYTLQDDSRVIFGNMFGIGADGQIKVQNAELIAKYAPAPAEKDLSSLWGEAEQSEWFAQGASDANAKSIVYTFVDANCIFCHFAYKAFEPYLDVPNTTLQVRWIPVAVLGPSSVSKAAALIASDDPVTLMREGHDRWEEEKAEGFATIEATGDHRTIIEQNNAFMISIEATGTPAFIYKDEAGKVKIAHGMQGLSVFSEMAHMPAITNTNPALKRFED